MRPLSGGTVTTTSIAAALAAVAGGGGVGPGVDWAGRVAAASMAHTAMQGRAVRAARAVQGNIAGSIPCVIVTRRFLIENQSSISIAAGREGSGWRVLERRESSSGRMCGPAERGGARHGHWGQHGGSGGAGAGEGFKERGGGGGWRDKGAECGRGGNRVMGLVVEGGVTQGHGVCGVRGGNRRDFGGVGHGLRRGGEVGVRGAWAGAG
jgi:hypothetical protein